MARAARGGAGAGGGGSSRGGGTVGGEEGAARARVESSGANGVSSASSVSSRAAPPRAAEGAPEAGVRELERQGEEQGAALAELEELYETVQRDKEEAVRALESRLEVEAGTASGLRAELRRLREVLSNPAVAKAKVNGAGDGGALKALQRQLDAALARESEREVLLKETTDALYEWKDECDLLQQELEAAEAKSGSTGALARAARPSAGAGSAELDSALAAQQAEHAAQQAEHEARVGQLEAEVNAFKSAVRDASAQLAGADAEAAGKAAALNGEVNLYKDRLRAVAAELALKDKELEQVRDVEYAVRNALHWAETRRGILEEELEASRADTSSLVNWSRRLLRAMSKL
jgi:chromosome segregation ATPase